MGSDLSWIAIFLAGTASFLSPCVWPLMPVYISYLMGDALEPEQGNKRAYQLRLMVQASGFLLGFLTVNGILGLTATGLGQLLLKYTPVLRPLSGAILILLGLFHLGIFRWGWLGKERRMKMPIAPPKFMNAVLIGIVFSFGWTPCTGAVLASVLVVAANHSTLWNGIGLLMVYSLGFGLPFMLSALFLDRLLRSEGFLERWSEPIKKVTGILIILAGILIATGKLDQLLSLI